MPSTNAPRSPPAPVTERKAARLPVTIDATAPRVGRAYRVRSLAAKLALAPTILVMLCCYYGSVTWTVYISMTRSFLLPVYRFAGTAQYERLFATPRWHVAYGNMFFFCVLDIIGPLGLGILLS